MQGIGPGSILGGRYVAGQRAAQHQDVELWTARDATLDRAVALLAISREHPNVDAVLDAARRVAGLDNGRLSRILDVAVDGDVAYVVEESLEGSRTLGELLEAGPLPAPEVRRIAGETAIVLDVARHRGLHHQQLHPGVVLRTLDGDIKVRGLATLAALAGIDHIPDHDAARADAAAVVALAYAGLTGHWPLPGDSGGLPPAPEIAGRTAAPSEIAGGVPADLDTLCRLTFSGGGPTTPGDFARQIAPWSPIPMLLPTVPQARETSPPDNAVVAPASAPSDASTAPGVSGDGPPDVLVAHRVPAPGAAAPVPVVRDSDVDSAVDTNVPDTGAPGSDAPDTDAPGSNTPGSAAPDAEETTETSTGDAPGAPPPSDNEPSTSEASTALVAAAPAAPLGPSPLATAGAKTAAAFGAAGAATAEAARSVSGRISEWSAGTRDKARTASQERKTRRDEAAAARAAERAVAVAEDSENLESSTNAPQTGEATGAAALAQSSGRTAQAVVARRQDDDRLEPPVPLLPPSAAEPLTRDQSRMAIGIIVGVLVLAFAFALWGLSQIPSIPGFSGDDGPLITPTEPANEAEEDAGSTDEGDTAPAPDAAGQPLTFANAFDYDPLGDGEERAEDLPKILDGDDSTYWQSQGYQNATFSGLKPGIGVVLDLGEPSTISEVTLELPIAAKGSIYVTDDDAYADTRPAIKTDMERAGAFSGEGSVSVELAAGTEGRYVIVWFTEVSRSGEWYRARLAGASATS